MTKFFLTVSFFCFYITAYSQQDRIISDRPSNSYVPFTIPKYFIQSETGLHLSSIKINSTKRDRLITHPQLLLKYGLLKNLELRTLTEVSSLYESNVNSDTYITGLSNFQIGAKYFIVKNIKWRPAIGVVAHYSFNNLRANGLGKDTINGANLRVAFENVITKKISLVYNAGITIERFGGRKTYVYSVSPRFQLGEDFNLFVELYGNAWKKRKPFNSVHTGLSYFVNDDFKLDAAIGIGFSKIYPDRFCSIGASYRLDSKR